MDRKKHFKTKAEMRSEGLLKPCPFCGGQARLKKHYRLAQTWYVQCNQCGIRTKNSTQAGYQRWTEARDYPVYLWNRRESL